MDEYGGKKFACKTEFFSSYTPDMIEEALIEYITDKSPEEPKVHEKKYKIKFALATAAQGDAEPQLTKMCCRILKVNDETNCVEFTKTEGDQYNYNKHYNDITTTLEYVNDAVI